MKGNITHYDLCGRVHVTTFSKRFFAAKGPNAKRDSKLGPNNLGRSWSGFVYERDAKRWLVLFDSDDGTGGTPADCKLQWAAFQNVLNEFKIDDYVIFKAQFANLVEQTQHYPFKWDVYPTCIMSDDPNHIHTFAKSYKNSENPEIDVLFVGGKVHEANKPHCWPKNRDLNQWWSGNRRIGYQRLLEIKEKRKDLKILAVDGLLDSNEFYKAVSNSKICLDLPGVGQSSRKFFEFLVLNKCVVSLQQQVTCWELKPDFHYSSLGFDFDYQTLEATIDNLLTNNEWKFIASNTKELQHKLTHEFLIHYVCATLDEHIDKKLSSSGQFYVTYPR